ncbi:pyruvate/2-oxoglutarate dehydrogenase complex dihydrolipoamide acyltransferase (E2) component [Microbacterium endophyticum]|uniref:hypothetical protein n=1 Tax=Microbacterium endophyticum TaxID=1526412 RepID=UPI0013EB0B8C|nr:hypothetical protein [Microbacterium endophyticum]NIK36159.1 pyruvate/2-oxoglutarate dehydrogenase complex dihydrolipoamide acyltransferase (E2) component [Microbacterium endophyticum]
MDTQRLLRKVVPIVAVSALIAALAGCSASPAAPASSPTASEAVDSDAAASPTPFTTPPATDDEVARALFEADGPDGVPASASITSDVIDEDTLVIDGACVGTSARYRLTTAEVDADQLTLTEGTLRCDEPQQVRITGLDYTGPVQLSFSDANNIKSGWLTLTPES